MNRRARARRPRSSEGNLVNKSQLIDALAARYEGNRKAAAHALDAVLDTITREVAKGEKVAITGFGSFEKRIREARWVRNPQTGARIKAKKTAVPKFSAGADLKNVISGAKKLPKLVTPKPAAKKAAPAKAAGPGQEGRSAPRRPLRPRRPPRPRPPRPRRPRPRRLRPPRLRRRRLLPRPRRPRRLRPRRPRRPRPPPPRRPRPPRPAKKAPAKKAPAKKTAAKR